MRDKLVQCYMYMYNYRELTKSPREQLYVSMGFLIRLEMVVFSLPAEQHIKTTFHQEFHLAVLCITHAY